MFVVCVPAYLSRGPYNVILVNWPRLAVLPWYITAVKNAKIIGSYLAHMMSWLEAQKAVPLSKIHVIGFSLGAEAAGFLGKALAPRKVSKVIRSANKVCQLLTRAHTHTYTYSSMYPVHCIFARPKEKGIIGSALATGVSIAMRVSRNDRESLEAVC